MLSLLTIDQAALHLLHWSGKLPDPTAPDALQRVLKDNKLHREHLLLRMFLNNAIDAGELPCRKKAKPKAEEKRLMANAGVPEEDRDIIPKIYDIWITWEDLTTFAERPEMISENSYSHSRESLARIAWMLVKNAELGETTNALQSALDEIVIDFDTKGIDCKLGESTLKSCCREILAVGEVVQNKA